MTNVAIVFRGWDVEELTHHLAKIIAGGRFAEAVAQGALDPANVPEPDHNDEESARRALAHVAKVVDAQQAETFNYHMRERRRIEEEAHAFYRRQLRQCEERLAAVGELLEPGRKTVRAEEVKAALNLVVE